MTIWLAFLAFWTVGTTIVGLVVVAMVTVAERADRSRFDAQDRTQLGTSAASGEPPASTRGTPTRVVQSRPAAHQAPRQHAHHQSRKGSDS